MKERLKCKSFDWFMTEIAYDVFEKYPKLPPNKYWGELRNEANDNCLDTFGRHPPEKVKHLKKAKLKNLNHGCTHGEESSDIFVRFLSPPTYRFSSLH